MSNFYCLIDDKKPQRGGAREYHEMDKPLFEKMNQEGWGVFFAVNDFGGKARKQENCIRLRHTYGDLDIAKKNDGQTREEKEAKKKILLDALIQKCPPTMIIDTSNGLQPLWALKSGDMTNKEQYVRILKGIIKWSKEFGAMGDNVYDVSRILRCPNYYHQKEEPYMCKIIFEKPNKYTLDELFETFPYEEEKKKVVSTYTGKLTEIDQAIERLNIQEIVIKAFEQVGRSASFDRQDRLVLDGRATGTFQGRKDDRAYIASSSHEPFKGNKVTVVADILQITPKEARKWIIDEYNLNYETELAKRKTIKNIVPEKDYKLRYTWGTKHLDENFAIIKRETFIVLAAKRGSGKTTFAFDLACKNARRGHRVLFVSLEMKKDLIKQDFARRRAGISITEEYDYQIPENKQALYEEKIKEIDEIENLFFSGIQRGSDITWDGVKLLIAEHKDLDLIIIDNLDLIDKGEKENDLEKQKRIVKNVMNFTADQQIPVILIHHYRKSKPDVKEHGMDELSGSGKIADSADYVVKVTRTSDIEAPPPEKYRTRIHLQKARGYNEAISDVYFINGTFIDKPND